MCKYIVYHTYEDMSTYVYVYSVSYIRLQLTTVNTVFEGSNDRGNCKYNVGNQYINTGIRMIDIVVSANTNSYINTHTHTYTHLHTHTHVSSSCVSGVK